MRPLLNIQMTILPQLIQSLADSLSALGLPKRNIKLSPPNNPDFGDFFEPDSKNYSPVFWACGVTPQIVALKSKIPIMITHSPGHMFITDLRDDDFKLK